MAWSRSRRTAARAGPAPRALPGLPPLSFVNDVEASLHDARTIYAVADAHKTGDFTPYVYESIDLGRTWRSIAGDLPKGTIVWAIQQDHVRPELLFVGTEFGIYFSPNRGTNWFKLNGGVPTISFRDLKLQRRDNDLVGASFGRGFYILDDYSPLREIAAGALAQEGALFPVRDAWWYVPSQPSQAPGRPEKGSDDFTTDNPPFGALLTYYLRQAPTTAREARQATEKVAARAGRGRRRSPVSTGCARRRWRAGPRSCSSCQTRRDARSGGSRGRPAQACIGSTGTCAARTRTPSI